MKRFLKALFSNGSASIISMGLSVIVARQGGTEALGEFALAYSVYIIVQLCAREAGISPLLAEHPSRRVMKRQAARSSLIGLVFSVPALACGLLLGSFAVVVVAICLNGMMLLNYSKTLSLTIADGKDALYQDAVLFLIVGVAGLTTLMGLTSSDFLVLTWAVGSAAVGYVTCWIQRMHMWPSWRGRGAESRTSIVFGGQSLLGSGSVHILTFLLTAVGGASLVGSIRGATTMVGPANLLITTVQPLAIRYLARTSSEPRTINFKQAVKAAGVILLGYSLLTAALVFTGMVWGHQIFGQAWNQSAPLLLLVACDGLAVCCAVVPIAAHRTVWASGRAARITVMLLFVRFPLVLGGAYFGGAVGAGWGFLLSTCVATTTWWVSIYQLARPPRPANEV